MTDNRGLGVKSGYNKESWESSEFPSVCETCLGSSPYMRMVKLTYAGTCKMCEKPYTLFRWNPRQGARQKRTEICQTCARMKNICQCCLRDLQYGLPVQLRDAVLAANEAGVAAPESDANREYFASQQNQLIATGQDPWLSAEPNEQLLSVARQIKTNRQDDQLKITLANAERKRAAVDPEAAETIERSKKRAAVQNAGIESALVLEGITDLVTADDVRDTFFKFGDIKAIRLYHEAKAAIVWFVELTAAQNAIAELSPQGVDRRMEMKVKNATQLTLRWAAVTDMAEIVEEQQHQKEKEDEQQRKLATTDNNEPTSPTVSASTLPLPPGMTAADLKALPAAPSAFTPAANAAAPQLQAHYPPDVAQQWQQYYAYYGYPMPAAAPAPVPVAQKLPPKPKGPPPAHAFRNQASQSK